MNDEMRGGYEERAHPLGTGVQRIYQFPNGYGASVIRSPYSYGGPTGRWELAVLAGPVAVHHICYDVLGHLDVDEVNAALDQIANSPAYAECGCARKREELRARLTAVLEPGT